MEEVIRLAEEENGELRPKLSKTREEYAEIVAEIERLNDRKVDRINVASRMDDRRMIFSLTSKADEVVPEGGGIGQHSAG